jgi:hypothetical protein
LGNFGHSFGQNGDWRNAVIIFFPTYFKNRPTKS